MKKKKILLITEGLGSGGAERPICELATLTEKWLTTIIFGLGISKSYLIPKEHIRIVTTQKYSLAEILLDLYCFLRYIRMSLFN